MALGRRATHIDSCPGQSLSFEFPKPDRVTPMEEAKGEICLLM